MSAPPIPIDSTADYPAQLEIIQKIESLGGSVGYDSNPDAYSEIAPVLDSFDSNVWIKSIKELGEHEKDPDAQALKAKLQAEVDLQHSDPKLAQKRRVLNIIKGIEILGGSTGLKTYTESVAVQKKLFADNIQRTTITAKGWPSAYAWGFVASSFFITSIALRCNGHAGGGYAWGPALRVGNLQGNLSYESFDADGFSFQSAAGVAAAEITLRGRRTSQFVGALIGVSVALSFGGTFSW